MTVWLFLTPACQMTNRCRTADAQSRNAETNRGSGTVVTLPQSRIAEAKPLWKPLQQFPRRCEAEKQLKVADVAEQKRKFVKQWLANDCRLEQEKQKEREVAHALNSYLEAVDPRQDDRAEQLWEAEWLANVQLDQLRQGG